MTDKEQLNTRKAAFKITINEKWCKKCGVCIAFCPKMVFTADDFGLPIVKDAKACIKCNLCVIRCPEFAVEVKNEDSDK